MKFESDYIEKLAKIIADNDLTEISLEDGEQAITIRKDLPEVNMVASAPAVAAVPQSAPVAPAQVSAPAQAPAAKEEVKGKAITSPMVGTFYAASSPDAAPFVEVGSTVNVGDVVCIIEAMKLMNEIKAEQAGKVVQICVKNGDPIEFGQVLMYVE
ncbi:acetyl-CoA carboxylase biotin carboxyl carrier protein [bacterium]|nr:acetyl-CoA carboxylase biotin carboxyl carrier protein [bacterium]